MRVCYTLSNRQKKELLVRGTPLLLAIPLPPEEVADLTAWARGVLPTDLRDAVRSAEEDEVRVRPLPRRPEPLSLDGLLGEIRGDDGAGAWTVGVAVALVRLGHGAARHPGRPKPQWPGGVTVDGRPLLAGANGE